ncbi:hypothetical protein SteCoe_2040 [Stentor coeruleus]|uniref:Uncharacterized protein n=1 Tax=Stentor coeruleus TaxID=5963 RepID=A0A1R2D0E3_9CILI|nr:hypothetical protein SteCoe_2040 [Stentor coeruleus]
MENENLKREEQTFGLLKYRKAKEGRVLTRYVKEKTPEKRKVSESIQNSISAPIKITWIPPFFPRNCFLSFDHEINSLLERVKNLSSINIRDIADKFNSEYSEIESSCKQIDDHCNEIIEETKIKCADFEEKSRYYQEKNKELLNKIAIMDEEKKNLLKEAKKQRALIKPLLSLANIECVFISEKTEEIEEMEENEETMKTKEIKEINMKINYMNNHLQFIIKITEKDIDSDLVHTNIDISKLPEAFTEGITFDRNDFLLYILEANEFLLSSVS